MVGSKKLIGADIFGIYKEEAPVMWIRIFGGVQKETEADILILYLFTLRNRTKIFNHVDPKHLTCSCDLFLFNFCQTAS